MKRLVSLLVFLVLLLPVAADAFDGNRKGFVFGGGLGVSPAASWKAKNTNADETQTGLSVHLIIGYGFDSRNFIVYEGNIVDFESGLHDDETVIQGFRGLALYHYFGSGDRHPFLMGGLGYYAISWETFRDNDPGFGSLVGVGYEFIRHLQIGACVSAGNTSASTTPVDFEHSHVSLTLTAVAF